MQDKEQVASPAIALLSSARARYRFGSQMAIIRTRAEAETIREALEESGSWCRDRATIAAISVARERPMSSTPMVADAYFSILKRLIQTCRIDPSSIGDVPKLPSFQNHVLFLAW